MRDCFLFSVTGHTLRVSIMLVVLKAVDGSTTSWDPLVHALQQRRGSTTTKLSIATDATIEHVCQAFIQDLERTFQTPPGFFQRMSFNIIDTFGNEHLPESKVCAIERTQVDNEDVIELLYFSYNYVAWNLTTIEIKPISADEITKEPPSSPEDMWTEYESQGEVKRLAIMTSHPMTGESLYGILLQGQLQRCFKCAYSTNKALYFDIHDLVDYELVPCEALNESLWAANTFKRITTAVTYDPTDPSR